MDSDGEFGGAVGLVDSRRLGGVYVLDELWSRLGISRALIEAADGRRLDGQNAEEIIAKVKRGRAALASINSQTDH